jgi:hypothetical protein
MYFKGKYDGISIEEFIKFVKLENPITWRIRLSTSLMDYAEIWWQSLDSTKMMALLM